jgi:hypothetical protein
MNSKSRGNFSGLSNITYHLATTAALRPHLPEWDTAHSYHAGRRSTMECILTSKYYNHSNQMTSQNVLVSL